MQIITGLWRCKGIHLNQNLNEKYLFFVNKIFLLVSDLLFLLYSTLGRGKYIYEHMNYQLQDFRPLLNVPRHMIKWVSHHSVTWCTKSMFSGGGGDNWTGLAENRECGFAQRK